MRPRPPGSAEKRSSPGATPPSRPCCLSSTWHWKNHRNNPSPASRERVARPERGETGEGLAAAPTLTLPSLRAGPLPLPRCGRGASLTARPAQHRAEVAAAEQVEMEMRHVLVGGGAVVGEDPVAGLGDAFLM